MFFVVICFSFNNQIRFNSKGMFNLPVGKRDFNNSIQNKVRKFVAKLQKQDAYFLTNSFETFDFNFLTKDSFVYCGPPYTITTAGYNENAAWTTDNDIQLFEILDNLNSRGIKFGLSNVLTHKGKINTTLNEWLNQRKYFVHHLNYSYKNSNYQTSDEKGGSDEIFVCNYETNLI